jgi:hypothetical protein
MHDVLLRDTDQMSMAHGLEVRVPCSTIALVDYVTAVGDSESRAGPAKAAAGGIARRPFAR